MPSTRNVGMADTLKTSLMRRSIGPCELLACILGADFPLGSSHLLVTTRFCPGKRKVTITDTGGRRTDFRLVRGQCPKGVNRYRKGLSALRPFFPLIATEERISGDVSIASPTGREATAFQPDMHINAAAGTRQLIRH
jgi:hypothetical protein